MKHAASVSNRAKARYRIMAQGIILNHLKILNGKSLWSSRFYIDKKDSSLTCKVAGVPSIEAFEQLAEEILVHKGQIKTMRDGGGYLLTPSIDGHLILTDRTEEFGERRFKARKDFGKFLQKICLLLITRPEFEASLIEAKRKASNEDYEYQRTTRESRQVIRLSDTSDDRIVLKGTVKGKVLGTSGIEKQFVKRYWGNNYEDYKKFRQRAKREGLI